MRIGNNPNFCIELVPAWNRLLIREWVSGCDRAIGIPYFMVVRFRKLDPVLNEFFFWHN